MARQKITGKDGEFAGHYVISRADAKWNDKDEWFGFAESSADAMQRWLGEDYADFVRQTVRKGKRTAYLVRYISPSDAPVSEWFSVIYYWSEAKGGALDKAYYMPGTHPSDG